jgi:hypothetical protein
MAAYVIFMRETTTDEQEMKRYSELALPTLTNRPVTPLAFYGALDVLEGPAFEGAVCSTMSKVNDALDHLRAGKARYRIVLENDLA